MKPLLIIKTGSVSPKIREIHGDMEHLILTAAAIEPASVLVVPVFEGATLPDHKNIRGAIITGSSAMVTDSEPWSTYTEEWLRRAHGDGLPLLGICYGHQLLAQALGGTVGYHPGGLELGTVKIQLTEAGKQDSLLRVMPEEFLGHVTHYQTVLRLPPDAQCLAFNAFEPHHAFLVGTSTWGTQFHPEFTAPVMADYIELRAQSRSSSSPEGITAPAVSHPFGSTLLKRFLQIAQ